MLVLQFCLGLGLAAAAQQASQPQVKVNVLNVCSPSPEEQQEIASALARVPRQPLFAADFEIDRGRSSLDVGPGFLQPGSGSQMSSDPGVANWVRIRREFSVQALFSTVQYSFSSDPKNMVETLGLPGARSEGLDAGLDRRQRFGCDISHHHADHQHASQPGQAGALRQVVCGAGKMLGLGGGSGAGSERIRTPVSERVRSVVELSRIAGCANHCARGVSTGWKRRES